ncbi:hypothetical protein MASR2M78_29750 [Treponema sp.]
MINKEILDAIVDTVVKEFDALNPPAPSPALPLTAAVAGPVTLAPLIVPATPVTLAAASASISDPVDADGLAALMESTSARIGVGRAGPRPPTGQLLAFQADLAVTKDALTMVVAPGLLDELGLFSVRTRVEGGTEEYLRRPDLGRRLSPESAGGGNRRALYEES